MKAFPLAVRQHFALVVSVAVSVCPFLPTAAQAGNEPVESEFPYVIQAELGAVEYAPGDSIAITSIRGNRQHLEPGGRYLLEGTYELASAESADLAWFATSRGPSESTPVADDEHVKINKGSGNFRLKKTLQSDGWLHVSFYVDGRSHGGVYFGEKGVENTVLRQKGWSDFSKVPAAETPHPKPGGDAGPSAVSEPANLAIIAYLGKPVAAPADLDAKYSPKELETVFKEISRKAGLRVQELAVDDTEFPFLVYGLLAGKHEFRVLQNGLRELKDYGYGGSVVGTTDKEMTYFSLNMIPYSQFPSAQAVACNRRLMVRLQMLADAARQAQ